MKHVYLTCSKHDGIVYGRHISTSFLGAKCTGYLVEVLDFVPDESYSAAVNWHVPLHMNFKASLWTMHDA